MQMLKMACTGLGGRNPTGTCRFSSVQKGTPRVGV